ncbi:sulfatase [Natrinema sp. SYSU A 869]|uniref:sulfatase n=1 Tax=Natrinema sp. SYSU A 869 TaxID=2871694 RepID=UPI001CA39673|nr:sulfatase [Natrinema sp. SYSU A 869]
MRSNILFVIFDTARADIVSEMIEADELPALKRLAESGEYFSSVFSTSPWTLPSHASMFTGQRSHDHGAHYDSPTFDPSVTPLPAALSDSGYRTVGISGNPWISPEFGFDVGFDALSMKWDLFWNGDDISAAFGKDSFNEQLLALVDNLSVRNVPKTILNTLYAKFLSGRSDKGGQLTATRTSRWLQKHTNDAEPFFYFVNFLEPHLEYNPPDELAAQYVSDIGGTKTVNQDPWKYLFDEVKMGTAEFEALRGLYKAELVYTDKLLGQILDTLDETGLSKDTAVIVAGDHGENIGDHGLMDHQYGLHDTLVQIPLIVRTPQENTVTETDSLIELRDLYPTILSLADCTIPPDETVSSNSLYEDGEREHVCATYLHPPDRDLSLGNRREKTDVRKLINRRLRMVRTNKYKLIDPHDGEARTVNVGSEEDSDDTDLCSGVTERLLEIADDEGLPLDPTGEKQVELSEHSRQQLEDLGYL